MYPKKTRKLYKKMKHLDIDMYTPDDIEVICKGETVNGPSYPQEYEDYTKLNWIFMENFIISLTLFEKLEDAPLVMKMGFNSLKNNMTNDNSTFESISEIITNFLTFWNRQYVGERMPEAMNELSEVIATRKLEIEEQRRKREEIQISHNNTRRDDEGGWCVVSSRF